MTARLTFAGSVVCFLLALVSAGLLLPAEVPLHFGGSGEPDRWGSRTEALVTMGLGGGLLALLLGGGAALVDMVPVVHLNVPHKAWWIATPARERRVRSMMRTDLYAIAAATMLLLVVVVAATTGAARSEDPALGPLFLAGLACYLTFVTGWTAWSLRTRYRPRTDT